VYIREVTMHYHSIISPLDHFNGGRYTEKAPLVFHSAIVRSILQVQVRVRVLVQPSVSNILRYIPTSFCLNHPIIYCAVLSCWTHLRTAPHCAATNPNRTEKKKTTPGLEIY
jgi:hypothetical protein